MAETATDTAVMGPAADAKLADENRLLRSSLDTIARKAVGLVAEIQSLRHRVNNAPKPGEEMRTVRVLTDLVLVEEEGVLDDELREQLRLALEDIAVGAGASGVWFDDPITMEVPRDSY